MASQNPLVKQEEGFSPKRISRWSPNSIEPRGMLPLINGAEASPILPGYDLWDCWPLQHEDGATVQIDGTQYWFFLSSPRFDDPSERHLNAKIRVMALRNERWSDQGCTLEDTISPGHAEWAGSSVLHEDSTSISLFFTASGYRDRGPGFEQRIFACQGTLEKGFGPGKWQAAEELIEADGEIYSPANVSEGAPGMIKAFRDPAWFRDPEDNRVHLLFTGSAAWSQDPHNGLIGHATKTTSGWAMGKPLIHSVGCNNELERPHIIVRNGLNYMFWSTQRRTFSSPASAGPNGLYGAVAERFDGPWTPLNGDGLVACNPTSEPTQAYSWWVTGEGQAWSFIDHWGMDGREFATHPDLIRSQFGGTPAPRFALAFDGMNVTIV